MICDPGNAGGGQEAPPAMVSWLGVCFKANLAPEILWHVQSEKTKLFFDFESFGTHFKVMLSRVLFVGRHWFMVILGVGVDCRLIIHDVSKTHPAESKWLYPHWIATQNAEAGESCDQNNWCEKAIVKGVFTIEAYEEAEAKRKEDETKPTIDGQDSEEAQQRTLVDERKRNHHSGTEEVRQSEKLPGCLIIVVAL